MRRIFARNFPNLSELILGPSLCKCFLMKIVVEMTSNKGLHVILDANFLVFSGSLFRLSGSLRRFLQILPRFPRIFPRFSGILSRFSPNQNFWGCTCIRMHSRLLHHWSKQSYRNTEVLNHCAARIQTEFDSTVYDAESAYSKVAVVLEVQGWSTEKYGKAPESFPVSTAHQTLFRKQLLMKYSPSLHYKRKHEKSVWTCSRPTTLLS